MSLDKIEKIIENRKKIKKEIYTEIYTQLSRKIVQAVEQGRSQVFLEVPGFLVGYPLFDRAKATAYTIRQFEHERKFETVQLIGDFEIYVSLARRKQKTTKPPSSAASSDYEFPTLMNLRKTANKLR